MNDMMPVAYAVGALVLGGYALMLYRTSRVRGRMFACLSLALALGYAEQALGMPALRWVSWGFLALGLVFMALGRRQATGD